MTDLDDFSRNARENGLLIDTNLLVLLIVGLLNRDRISRFKRTTSYSSADWDLLSGILERISLRYTLPHVLAEVSTLTDLKGSGTGHSKRGIAQVDKGTVRTPAHQL